MTRPTGIPVVCALIVDLRSRVLVAQRPPHKHQGGKWEFAGGKVEPGERPETALVREIAEELGCVITHLRPLSRTTHDDGTVVVELIPFVCALASDSPLPDAREHSALRWVALPDLLALDLAPADVPIVQELLSRGIGI